MAYVRYLVSDVQKAVDFYSAHLDFTVQQQFPAMAILKRGDLTRIIHEKRMYKGLTR